MNIEDLTIRQAKELAAMFPNAASHSAQPHPFIGRHCVVRTYSEGVHIGTVSQVSEDGKQVLLTDSRRLYSWSGAFTLSAVAQTGVAANSRLAVEIPELYVTECISMIPTTPEARATFDAASN